VHSNQYRDIITLRKTSEAIAGKAFGLNNYTNLVVNGGFYEYIQKHFKSLYPDRFYSRDKVKQEVLRIFNVENNRTGANFYKPCKTFHSHFPEVSEMFTLIKEIQSNYLALILQRIESFLIIDIVCKKISELHPEILFLTIHDNIITTKGNEGIVKKIMTAEIEKWTGHKPKLDCTMLKPEKIKISTMIYQLLLKMYREYAASISIFWKQSFGGLFKALKGYTSSVILEQ